ncbi:tryptophan-rich sensory protein [Candidatus Woesearchaeota archaeon]|nr:tryptophan-rich sensory protein [Candidatus Woesearchaeota archaeon]
MNKKQKKRLVRGSLFILSVLICSLPGIIGSMFTAQSVSTWYETLVKPIFSPPNWVFGPVWTLLYFLMAVSLFLILINKKKNWFAFTIFGIQLVLNGLWSYLFFGLQSPLAALFCINFLWVSIIVMIATFFKISKTASLIQLPYFLWVTFAAVLNFSIFVLN